MMHCSVGWIPNRFIVWTFNKVSACGNTVTSKLCFIYPVCYKLLTGDLWARGASSATPPDNWCDIFRWINQSYDVRGGNGMQRGLWRFLVSSLTFS